MQAVQPVARAYPLGEFEPCQAVEAEALQVLFEVDLSRRHAEDLRGRGAQAVQQRGVDG